MANSLGLNDDLDGVELVIDIEKAFNIKITDDEAEDLRVVGQLYDLLMNKISLNETNRKCATAMVFYRLRQVIRDLRNSEKLLPSTDLSFIEHGRTKKNWMHLAHASGLRLPNLNVACQWPLMIALIITAAAIPAFVAGFILMFLSTNLDKIFMPAAAMLLIGGFALAFLAITSIRATARRLPHAGRANKESCSSQLRSIDQIGRGGERRTGLAGHGRGVLGSVTHPTRPGNTRNVLSTKSTQEGRIGIATARSQLSRRRRRIGGCGAKCGRRRSSARALRFPFERHWVFAKRR